MSRAFTKDEAPEAPLVVPPRAPLPEGVPNYVTPRGLALLREERAELEAERSALEASTGDPDERRRAITALAQRIAALHERLGGARLVDPRRQAPGTVRFGARVEVEGSGGETRVFQIVGVDEADAEAGRVAFTSPIAVALTGKKAGEEAVLTTPQGEERLTVRSVAYGDEDPRPVA